MEVFDKAPATFKNYTNLMKSQELTKQNYEGPLREEFRAQLKLMQDAATTELTNVKKQYEYWLKEKETAMETFTEKFNAYRTKKSNHVPSQHTLSMHPLIHHHIEPKKVVMFLLMYRLTHPLITPCKHNLSTHPLNTTSQPTLSTHHRNPPSQHTLRTHTLIHHHLPIHHSNIFTNKSHRHIYYHYYYPHSLSSYLVITLYHLVVSSHPINPPYRHIYYHYYYLQVNNSKCVNKKLSKCTNIPALPMKFWIT